mmetsp:Transcript_8073/g.17240  ORF Transcript_8073/g.17240 Transcript_8073/m.17240 type:complete len:134 (-) Transcript_8073:3288-3689(-)
MFVSDNNRLFRTPQLQRKQGKGGDLCDLDVHLMVFWGLWKKRGHFLRSMQPSQPTRSRSGFQWCHPQLPKSKIFTRTSCTSVARMPSINSDCVAVNPVPIMHPIRSAMSWAVLHFSHAPSDCSFLTSSISMTN